MAADRRSVAALLAVLLGVVVLGVGVDAAATAAQPAYHHAVEPADDVDRIHRVANDSSVRAVYDFEALSANAQEAFLAAHAASDGEATVRGDENKPPEFAYGDTGTVGDGTFFVRYEGEYYVLRTSGRQFSAWVAAVPPLLVAALVGGSAVLAGALGYLGYDPRLSATTLVGTGVPVAFVTVGVHEELSAVAFTGVAAGSVAWYAFGWLWGVD